MFNIFLNVALFSTTQTLNFSVIRIIIEHRKRNDKNTFPLDTAGMKIKSKYGSNEATVVKRCSF